MILFFFLQLSLADSLFKHGYYTAARLEYDREFFFDQALYQNQHKRLRYATSIFYDDTITGIYQLNLMNHDFSPLYPEIKESMARLYLSARMYSTTIDLLEGSDNERLLGYIYLADKRFSTARLLFAKKGDSAVVHEIDLYQMKPGKSPRTAVLLSMLLPGAGEIYAGAAKQGIMDFLMNLGSGLLLYNALKQRKYVDAALIFSFLNHRFYLGSIVNAQQSAYQTNQQQHEEWLETMRMYYFQDVDH